MLNYLLTKALKQVLLIKKLVVKVIRIDFFFNVYMSKNFTYIFNKLNFSLFFYLKHSLIASLNTNWIKEMRKSNFVFNYFSLPWFKMVPFLLTSLFVAVFIIVLIL